MIKVPIIIKHPRRSGCSITLNSFYNELEFIDKREPLFVPYIKNQNLIRVSKIKELY